MFPGKKFNKPHKDMKKLVALASILLLFLAAAPFAAYAGEPDTLANDVLTGHAARADELRSIAPAERMSGLQVMHYQVKTKFIEGGAGFMSSILLCLIFGLAIALERVIYLNLASTNASRLLRNVEDALDTGGIESAKELCRNTRGPLASIFYQGLNRHSQGLDIVEKSIISYGSVQMGLLERGLSWIGLFIALAPMLGFLGTVIGMIIAFDNIQIAGDVSPTVVAGGIKIALITTVFGLIVAIVLQLFYNTIVAKIDSITNKMEDASISFMDILIKYNQNPRE
jgi:biopolymer transport protein ExbB